MPDLPARFAGLILAFAPLFVHRSWRHVQLLLIGAILTAGRRTVTSVLRILGRAQDRRLVNVHRILNRAAWSPRAGALRRKILLSGPKLCAAKFRVSCAITFHPQVSKRGSWRAATRPLRDIPEASDRAPRQRLPALRRRGSVQPLLHPDPGGQRLPDLKRALRRSGRASLPPSASMSEWARIRWSATWSIRDAGIVFVWGAGGLKRSML